MKRSSRKPGTFTPSPQCVCTIGPNPISSLLRKTYLEKWELIGRIISSEVPYSDSHPYRTLAKNCRYTLQYALTPNAMSRYAVAMKMDKKVLVHFGDLYLKSKPWLVAWKNKQWSDAWRTHETRTAFGRRRRLVGDRLSVMKEGLNHMIQGTVADLMKLIVTEVCLKCQVGLAYQSHDGFKFIVPGGEAQSRLEGIRGVAEKEWTLWGRPLWLPASWEVVHGH